MELDIIKSQTTWNDASQSINLNFAKIRQALASSGGGGGNIDALISTVYDISYLGSISTNDNSATFNAYAIDSLYKRIVLLENKEVDLTGYATETWVLAKNYITSAALSPYLKIADANSTFATLVALNALSGNVGSLEGDVSTLSSNLNTLKGRFDALDDALNDDVSGKINTWNEIVDFLDEYNGSEDLATILSGMNADIASRLKSSDFDTWKNDVYSPLVKRVSTAEGNISANATAITNLGKRVTANEGNIAEVLKWFAVDANGNLYTTYNLYSTKEISANGLSVGTGGSGGGLISQVYGTTAFGTIASESNSATFNAYAIDSLYKRIVSLEGKATAVSFVPALTSGKQIGTLSIDGVSTVLYGVDAYSKADADSTFLKLSGGTVTGNLNVLHKTSAIPLLVENKAQNYTAIAFRGANSNTAYLVYSGTGDTWVVTNVNWNRTSVLLHANNYSNYALPLSGGTIKNGDNGTPLVIDTTHTEIGVPFRINNINKGWVGHTASIGTYLYDYTSSKFIGVKTDGTPVYYDGSHRTLIHSGNIGDYAPLKKGRQSTIDLNIASNGYYEINYSSQTLTNAPSELVNAALFADFRDSNGYAKMQLIAETSGNLFFRAQQGASATINSAWKTVAFTDSNVASATKLATARTIWGQSFDGSGNVSGNIQGGKANFTIYGYNSTLASNVNILTHDNNKSLWLGYGMNAEGNATIIAGTGIEFRYGASRGVAAFINSSGNVTIGSSDLAGTNANLAVENILRVNDASMNAILNIANEGGSINYVHLFVSSANSSNTTTRPLVLQNGYGNVGIGINSPQYKLHVAGTARVSGNVSMGSTLSVTGLLTANSGIKVYSGQALTFLDASGKEHKLTYDSTAGAFKFDGNLYATGEVSGNGLHTN